MFVCEINSNYWRVIGWIKNCRQEVCAHIAYWGFSDTSVPIIWDLFISYSYTFKVRFKKQYHHKSSVSCHHLLILMTSVPYFIWSGEHQRDWNGRDPGELNQIKAILPLTQFIIRVKSFLVYSLSPWKDLSSFGYVSRVNLTERLLSQAWCSKQHGFLK